MLYRHNLQQWNELAIQQLQNYEFKPLNIEHLIEELVDLGKSEKNMLKSSLSILLAHLLKLKVNFALCCYGTSNNFGSKVILYDTCIRISKTRELPE